MRVSASRSPRLSPSGYRRVAVTTALSAAAVLALTPVSSASAVTSADGPISLGTATSFAVLSSSTVTNTGPTSIAGDLGVSAGSSVTGFPPGILLGVQHLGDATAIQAQTDVTTAYTQLSSLTPTDSTVYTELGGLTLNPGVYTAGVASITGNLTLQGDDTSIWVFQVTDTLTTGSGSSITINGGADSCNVFWRVASQAVLGTDSTFEGTVIAGSSIAATTGAVIDGRLLAQTEAVTLDDNLIVASPDCSTGTTIVSSPTITSGPEASATVGTPYSSAVTATASPAASYSITSGSLPPGLTMDATGTVTGTATTVGTSTFTITASNGVAPDDSGDFTITVAAASVPAAVSLPGTPVESGASLAATGPDVGAATLTGVLLLLVGALLSVRSRRRLAAGPRHSL